MNDRDPEVRDIPPRQRDEAPALDTSEAQHPAGWPRRRQVWTLVIGAIAVVVILASAGFGALMRTDKARAVLDTPTPSPTCLAMVEPDDAVINGWPDTSKNRAGVYSWGALRPSNSVNEGWMHNAYAPGSGDVEIVFQGDPGRLVPHTGATEVTVAGCEGTYRAFIGEVVGRHRPWEQWMVDIEGTTVTISLSVGPRASDAEVTEAHGIIDSIRAVPRDDPYGFRLLFTLRTGTWDSG
jgi:hypothetical protein